MFMISLDEPHSKYCTVKTNQAFVDVFELDHQLRWTDYVATDRLVEFSFVLLCVRFVHYNKQLIISELYMEKALVCDQKRHA